MDLGNGLGHLTYSTLVHPGRQLGAVVEFAQHLSAEGERALRPQQSFRRLHPAAAKTAETLANSPAERDKLKKFLADKDMYIYTANAFVYGHSRATR